MSTRGSLSRYACAASLALLHAGWCGAQKLVVVSSGDTQPYQQALSGLQKSATVVDSLALGTEREQEIAAAVSQAGRDTAIVTLGSAAATLVARATPSAPVVNCMLLAGNDTRSGNATGVPLDIPMDVQIAWLKRLLPDVRNVGILYDPAQNERRATEGAAALRRAGFQPVLEPVAGPTALPNALNRLVNRVDALLALPDTTVYAREHSRALLLFSFRHQIPLVGPTEGWVKAGALYSIDWDYTDLGRYCGSIAVARLAGAKPSHAAPALPPATRAVVNTRSAEQLRIQWGADVMRSVDRTYER